MLSCKNITACRKYVKTYADRMTHNATIMLDNSHRSSPSLRARKLIYANLLQNNQFVSNIYALSDIQETPLHISVLSSLIQKLNW